MDNETFDLWEQINKRTEQILQIQHNEEKIFLFTAVMKKKKHHKTNTSC